MLQPDAQIHGFFKDLHTGLQYATPDANATAEQIRAFYKDIPRTDWTEEKLTSYFNKITSADPLEGIWTLGPTYRIALLKKKNAGGEYEGIIVSSTNKLWSPGEIKLVLKKRSAQTYDVTLFLGDHSPILDSFQHNGTQLSSAGWTLYKTAAPAYKDPLNPPLLSTNVASSEFLFKQLTPYTALLRLPSFDRSFRDKMDSIVKLSWATVTQLPNLIIDIRGNGGGQDFMFDTLIHLAYTNEILSYDVLYRASEDNIKQYKVWDKKIVDSMEVYKGGYYRRHLRNRIEERILPLPRQIVVLTDKLVGSSAEQFVLYMKQSGKVTVVGENTSGTLDYGEPRSVSIPCSSWKVRFATSKHGRLPEYSVDAHGITPDVYVPAFEADWVDYSRRVLEKRIGPNRQ